MTLPKLILAVLVSMVSSTAVHAQTWSVYNYTGAIKANTVIDGTSFTAGAPISGQVYVLQGLVPGNDGWGFGGEVARYANSVNYFTFQTAGFDAGGTGAGDAVVHNNRRLVAAGGIGMDIFALSLPTEPTTTFTPETLGDGVTEIAFDLWTEFLLPNNATTGLALPSSVDPALFTNRNDMYVRFVDGSRLDARLTGITVSTSTQLPSLTSVPEPSAAAVLAIGLAGLCLGRRRNGFSQTLGAFFGLTRANASRS